MASIHPVLDRRSDLLAPLSPGRERLVNALDALGDEWDVYIQPRVGLDRPDVLAVHPDHGVVVIDVVDDGDRVDRQMFRTARTATVVVEQGMAAPDSDPLLAAAVRSIVFLVGHDAATATTILCDDMLSPAEADVEVWGEDSLRTAAERLEARLVPYLPATSLERLRSLIAPSECVLAPWSRRRSAPVNRSIALNEGNRRLRRVRSSAGAGGSSALAARAAHLAGEGRSVLVLTVNPALVRRLRTLVTTRCRQSAANPTLVTCASLHGFCRRVAEDATVEGMRLHLPAGVPLVDMNIARARAAYERGVGPRYDAILVDDGERLDPAWWSMLRDHVCAERGEMLVISTPARCTPERHDDWHRVGDDPNGSGVAWDDLLGGGRLPHDMVPIVRAFARDHLDIPPDALCVPDPLAVADGRTAPTVRRWLDQRSGHDLGRVIGIEVALLFETNPTLDPNDVAFLCNDHTEGLEAVRVIEALGLPVQHEFSLDPADQRRRSLRLWPGHGGITGATVSSFTGFEARAVVIGLRRTDDSRRELFVGLTRVSSPADGRPASVTVVNEDPGIDPVAFGFTGQAAWSPPAVPPAALGTA